LIELTSSATGANASFNGWVFTLTGIGAEPISGVTKNGSSTYEVPQANITFNATQIFVNAPNISYSRGQFLLLNLNSVTEENVPEPSSIVLIAAPILFGLLRKRSF